MDCWLVYFIDDEVHTVCKMQFDNINTTDIYAVKMLNLATYILLPSIAINLSVKCAMNKFYKNKSCFDLTIIRIILYIYIFFHFISISPGDSDKPMTLHDVFFPDSISSFFFFEKLS